MAKYILLTGGTGFIGSHLLEELLNLNKKIILLKRSFSNTWRIDEFKENENLILKDIDKENLKNIFNQYEIEGIFHLASFVQKHHELNTVEKMINSNVNFPTTLLENAVNNNVKFFINTGTCLEYSSKPPLNENSEIKPFNLYASTKSAFEDILKFYSNNYDIHCATLKLFTPYGPKDNEMKIIPYLIVNSIKKDSIAIKSPEKKLDFIYVKDVISSYITVMNHMPEFKEYTSFNIGTGIGTRIKDVLQIIESEVGKNEKIKYGDLENDEFWCSNKKIKNELNWAPKTELKKGIKCTIDYYKQIYGI